MKVEKVYEWFGNLTYLEQHKLTDKYFNSVNPTRLANGQVLEIYIEEQVNATLGSVSNSCDNCKNKIDCRFLIEAKKNGNICKFHIPHIC
jgi:hypothetical protein